MTEGNFKKGKRSGWWFTWFENDTKKSDAVYVNDKLNGVQIRWDQNGNIVFRGNYKNDKLEGTQKYYSDGELIKTEIYVDGSLLDEGE